MKRYGAESAPLHSQLKYRQSRAPDHEDDNDKSWTPDGNVDPAEQEDDDEDGDTTAEQSESKPSGDAANGQGVGTKRARDDVEEGNDSKKTKL